MKMNGAEIIIKLLEKKGITTIPGIPGGANLPLYDALYNSSIKHVLARHEQGAGFIACGMARATGKTAACFATSGPGATNLLTAIADAKLDSVPIIAITGQVPGPFIGTDAFQEVDVYGLSLPITKHNFLARSSRELLVIMPEAFRIAETGRPGPVLIDVPKDVQKEIIEIDELPSMEIREESAESDMALIREAAEMINKAKRPLLYIGGGVIASGSSAFIRKMAQRNSIPVALTLNGLGSYPAGDPLYVGMLGMHGARYTNYLLEEIDLLIALGARFDDRATGRLNKFCPDAKVIHADIDPAELGKLRNSECMIAGDLSAILDRMLPLVETNSRESWKRKLEDLRETYPPLGTISEDRLHPIRLIEQISEYCDSETIITTDVGQHQMWTAQAYPFKKPRTLLTSGGLGTMGFGLPAAIGAALENPGKRVVCISGDGSFLMNIQELATLADLNLPVTVFIMNNQHLGLVRQQQEMFYNGNFIASRFETDPAFSAIARGFGVSGMDITEEDDIDSLLPAAFEGEGPCIVNLGIHWKENVVPIVPPGAGNKEMIGDTV